MTIPSGRRFDFYNIEEITVIKITVNDKQNDDGLLDPFEMLDSDHGTVFQQYFKGKPCNEYYISCGHSEESVIHIWFSDEEGTHKLSTDNVASLRELSKSVRVKEIDATIEINLIV